MTYPTIDIDQIREFLQDYPALNILKDNMEQFSDELIETVIPMVVNEAVTLKPSLTTVVDKIPPVVWIHGIVAKLLQSESFVQLRNQITVGDNNNPGTSIFGKQGDYIQIANMFQQQFERLLDMAAKKVWYDGLWGSVDSNSADIEYRGYLVFPTDWRWF